MDVVINGRIAVQILEVHFFVEMIGHCVGLQVKPKDAITRQVCDDALQVLNKFF